MTYKVLFYSLVTLILVALFSLFFFLKNKVTLSSDTEGLSTNVTELDSSQVAKAKIIDITTADLDSMISDEEDALVHFWASWCIPCKEELPYLLKYADSSTTKLLLVTIDKNNDHQRWILKSVMTALEIPETYLLTSASDGISINGTNSLKSIINKMGVKYEGGIPYNLHVQDSKVINGFYGIEMQKAYDAELKKSIDG